MKGSEFLAANAGKSLSQWEREALALAYPATQGGDSYVAWPLVPVSISLASKSGITPAHTGTFYVASDYLALGTPEDYLRLPLTPITAQRIANLKNMLLPTSKMVDAIWNASAKFTPVRLVPNKGANLAQYQEHSGAIDMQLATFGPRETNLLSGTKKDIIISNIWKPGKVVIYGWYEPDGTRIQAKSNIHGDFYVDYSHGVRLVSPNMIVDGQEMKVEDVLKSPELNSLLSDPKEGTLSRVRYPTGDGSKEIAAATSPTGRLSYYKLGTSVIDALGLLSRKQAV